MGKIVLNQNQMEEVLECRVGKTAEVDGLIFRVVEEYDWTQDHKVQYSNKIIEVDSKFYNVDFDRSGSHWTDWYFGFRESGSSTFEWPEVVKVQITKYEWRAV